MFRIPMKSFHHTILFRLVLLVLIVILPIILLGIYLYYWSYHNAKEEISKNTLMQLSVYLEELHREVEWMEIQQYDIMQDRVLREIALTWEDKDNIEKKDDVRYLLQRLTSIKNTSAYIKDIHVHIRSIDRSISIEQGIHELNRINYHISQTMLAGHEPRLMKRYDFFYLPAAIVSHTKGEEPLYVVQVELDHDKLQESLNNLNMYPHSGTFLLSEEMELLAATGDIPRELVMQQLAWLKDESQSSHSLTTIDQSYRAEMVQSEKLGLSVMTWLPEDTVRKPLTKFYAWAWLFAMVSLFAMMVFFYSTYRLVHRPLFLLMKRFEMMEDGNLNISIDHRKNDEFGFLYDRFNQMLQRLQMLIDQDYKLKLMMQKAELKQLQSQINPHFLYNSFFILNSLAKVEDTERIEQFTKMLGEYFRFITRNTDEAITLLEEVRHARTYTEIQKLRFSRRIDVQFAELPGHMANIRVPRLIIQPIIENAFEHSLEKISARGLLKVSFEQQNQEAVIVVEDNGNQLRDAQIESLNHSIRGQADETTGLVNIHRRIVLTFGEGSGLFFSRSECNGLKVMIRIMLKEEMHDV